VLIFNWTFVVATWSSGPTSLDRYGAGSSNLVSSTTNFDSSKYPVCKADSRAKECNVFYECQNVCKTVNKQNCVTRYIHKGPM
jgi:hypothetical protein